MEVCRDEKLSVAMENTARYYTVNLDADHKRIDIQENAWKEVVAEMENSVENLRM